MPSLQLTIKYPDHALQLTIEYPVSALQLTIKYSLNRDLHPKAAAKRAKVFPWEGFPPGFHLANGLDRTEKGLLRC